MHAQPHGGDWNQRAIPTVPGQRPAQPADNYDTARHTKITRQRRSGEETDPQ
ncbi:hypothetical protein ACFXKW_20805 [Streptomyces sp. NPDC059193]|uniref:hypothetical protein n=1 Tax=Streptomyces sp. NPDC059193 TaxID=3346763 RepID=UPI003685C610